MDIEAVLELAEKAMGGRRSHVERETGFLADHGRRVAEIAMQLCEQTEPGIPRDVVYCGALLHDLGKGNEPHHLTGMNRARKQLKGICEPDEIAHICDMIENHNNRHRPNTCSIPAQIVQDSDVLDHAGAVGIWLAVHYSAHHDIGIDDTLEHQFSAKRQAFHAALATALNFDISRKMLAERVQIERHFFESLQAAQRGSL